MSEIQLVRKNVVLTDAQRAAMRELTSVIVDGLDGDDRKAWRQFWNWILAREPGEIFTIDTAAPRDGPFYRFHRRMERLVYKAQDRIQTLEAFRTWVKIGIGFCTWQPGVKGGIVPIPKSTSYKDCPEEVMRDVHRDMVAFFRTAHCQHFLWPHLTPERAEEMMESVLLEMDA